MIIKQIDKSSMKFLQISVIIGKFLLEDAFYSFCMFTGKTSALVI